MTSLRPYLLALCLSLLLPLLTKGQFTVYRTFDDFTNNTGTVYDGYEYVKGSGKSGFTIRNTSTKEKVEVDFEQIWAFSFRDRFYRVIRYGKYLSKGPKQVAGMLIHRNGAYFWLTDWWLEGIDNADRTNKSVKDKLTILPDFPAYLTATLDGDAMLLSNTAGGARESVKGGEAFFGDHPELEWLHECDTYRKHGYEYNTIGNCIDAHEPTEGDN